MNILIVICLFSGSVISELEARLDAARRDYDLPAAQAIAEEARKVHAQNANPETKLLLGHSLLLVAELARVDYEELGENGSRSQRRTFANRIDAAAREGLQIADSMGEVSEAHRIRADLHALMIRTKYQGKKYRARMERNAARAMELDPKNANAYVSVARPFLFAGPRLGGDIDKAYALLLKAVELDPKLDSARMMLAVAYEKRGDKEKADALWGQILAETPKASRSRKTLEIAGKVWSEMEDDTGDTGENSDEEEEEDDEVNGAE